MAERAWAMAGRGYNHRRQRYGCLARRNMPPAPGVRRKRRTRFVIPAGSGPRVSFPAVGLSPRRQAWLLNQTRPGCGCRGTGCGSWLPAAPQDGIIAPVSRRGATAVTAIRSENPRSSAERMRGSPLPTLALGRATASKTNQARRLKSPPESGISVLAPRGSRGSWGRVPDAGGHALRVRHHLPGELVADSARNQGSHVKPGWAPLVIRPGSG
jgi:hypothetical protein